ncbi:MAG: hypothetical protein KGI69_03920 [Patescibacteria group bacterium]|nr:hypothetical protein [Patescibacteria group bacterium]
MAKAKETKTANKADLPEEEVMLPPVDDDKADGIELEEEESLADDDADDPTAVLDGEDLDPFGDKWER